MARKPKTFYANAVVDSDIRRFSDQYAPYLGSLYVPTYSARGIIRALLKELSIPHLNRVAIEDKLVISLLHDNRILDEAVKQLRVSDPSIGRLLERSGALRLRALLAEHSSHSVYRMRQESDEVIQSLTVAPFGKSQETLKKWMNANLPTILSSLKAKHACFSGCFANTKWPPTDEDVLARIISPQEGNGPASVKNEILAYFHGVEVLTIRHYLEGRRPKTASRSKKPRS